MSDTKLKHPLQNKYYRFFSELYNRNKKFIIISAGVYFISLIIGLFVGYFVTSPIENFLTSLVKSDRQFVTENGISTASIFFHNLQSIFLTFAGGILVIITPSILFFNGFIYGSFLGFFASNHHIIGGKVSSVGLLNPTNFIIYTLPHGIFEISGFIIAGAAGFRITATIITLIMKDTPLSDHYGELKDAIALFAIAVILILIAAVIEANFSLSLGNYLTHLS
jgi:stage II sporulation protein M